MSGSETVAAGLLAAGIVVVGIWPAPLLTLVGGSTARIAALFAGS